MSEQQDQKELPTVTYEAPEATQARWYQHGGFSWLWGLLGLLVGNAVGGLLLWFIRSLGTDTTGYYSASAFVGVPMAMGLVSALCWRKQPLSFSRTLLLSLTNTVLGLCGAIFFFHEGTICLFMVFPLLYLFVATGTFLGRALFQTRVPPAVRASVAPLLIGGMVVDCVTPRFHENVVTTRSRPIHAAPQVVYQNAVAFAPIKNKPTYWLCALGLPAPEFTSVDTPQVGGKRLCVFTGNLVFEEKLTACEPGKRVGFDITRQPDHPELLGHAQVVHGEMELVANPDGTTTIIGRSTYRLLVSPAWYFDPWAQSIGHGVHERVFEHIALLSEKH